METLNFYFGDPLHPGAAFFPKKTSLDTLNKGKEKFATRPRNRRNLKALVIKGFTRSFVCPTNPFSAQRRNTSHNRFTIQRINFLNVSSPRPHCLLSDSRSNQTSATLQLEAR